MNLSALKSELESDPMGLGLTALYSAGRDAACAEVLNQVRDGNDFKIRRDLIPAHEIVSQIVASEWTSLSADNKNRISFIVSAGEVNPSSANVVAAFTTAFNGSTTMNNLVGILDRQTSRAVKLFGRNVSTADISATRTL